MNKTRFRRLASLLLALLLLFAISGCSIVRDVAELADALIESAAITNSEDPLPVQEQPSSSDAFQLVPDKQEQPDAPVQEEIAPAEELPTEAEQTSEEDVVLQDEQEQTVPEETISEEPEELEEPAVLLDSDYTSRDDVALYIHLYNHLPHNFITKSEARKCGWEGGSLEGIEGIPSGSCIGGDRFGNNEGLLPKAQGRTYFECDIDTQYAKSRGAKRIVFSNDGLVYYTEDHYESFELLYGEE